MGPPSREQTYPDGGLLNREREGRNVFDDGPTGKVVND
jgi:hypothetical protein